MIPILEKMNAAEYSDHRTISLISHASKVLRKILIKRTEVKATDFRSDSQFRFRSGCGSRDAIEAMRVLCQQSLKFISAM